MKALVSFSDSAYFIYGKTQATKLANSVFICGRLNTPPIASVFFILIQIYGPEYVLVPMSGLME